MVVLSSTDAIASLPYWNARMTAKRVAKKDQLERATCVAQLLMVTKILSSLVPSLSKRIVCALIRIVKRTFVTYLTIVSRRA